MTSRAGELGQLTIQELRMLRDYLLETDPNCELVYDTGVLTTQRSGASADFKGRQSRCHARAVCLLLLLGASAHSVVRDKGERVEQQVLAAQKKTIVGGRGGGMSGSKHRSTSAGDCLPHAASPCCPAS